MKKSRPSGLALNRIDNFVVSDMNSEFTIEIASRFEQLWRYNLAIVCACYDEQGERVDFCSAESFVASAGSKLREAPAGFDGPRELKLSTSACHSIVAYVYVVTNTEPVSNVIADSPPFDLKVKVRVGRKTLYNTVHKVSQWGGESIELKFKI